MKHSILLVVALSLSACASKSSQGFYKESAEYQDRQVLKESLTLEEGRNLSREEIDKILSSKIDLKRPLKFAVVKTDNMADSGYRTLTIAPLASTSSAKTVQSVIEKSKHIREISFVPKLMLPKEMSLRNLRDVAAIMQADILLILSPRSDVDSKFKLLGPNKGRAIATLEALAVDVRTGAIPFTSIATGTAETEKKREKEFTDEEFRIRTVLEAEDKAFAELGNDLVTYFQ